MNSDCILYGKQYRLDQKHKQIFSKHMLNSPWFAGWDGYSGGQDWVAKTPNLNTLGLRFPPRTKISLLSQQAESTLKLIARLNKPLGTTVNCYSPKEDNSKPLLTMVDEEKDQLSKIKADHYLLANELFTDQGQWVFNFDEQLFFYLLEGNPLLLAVAKPLTVKVQKYSLAMQDTVLINAIRSPLLRKHHGQKAKIIKRFVEMNMCKYEIMTLADRQKFNVQGHSLIPLDCGLQPQQEVMTPEGIGLLVGIIEKDDCSLTYQVILRKSMPTAIWTNVKELKVTSHDRVKIAFRARKYDLMDLSPR